MMNKYDEARQNFDKAVELDSKSATYYQNRGLTYSKEQDYDRALQDFSKAIALDPKRTSPYIGRGVVYKNKKMFNEALREFDSVLAMYPNDFLGNFHKACVFSLMNKVDEACKLLESAVRDGASRWPAMKNNIRSNPDFDNIRNSTCFKKIASE
jgi:tetratricopeptide (TPR) repeat protein